MSSPLKDPDTPTHPPLKRPLRPFARARMAEQEKKEHEARINALRYLDPASYLAAVGSEEVPQSSYAVQVPSSVISAVSQIKHFNSLEPEIPVKEMSYEEAVDSMAKETGPLITSFKNMPGRPVDIVLFDSKGASVAVFTLTITSDVTLTWLVSWIQMFIDRWVVKSGHSEVLVLKSIKVRHSIERKIEAYPPLLGVPIDEQRSTGNYFMKWECGDGAVNELYWNALRHRLQMGSHVDNKPKPIFKSYTVGFPLDYPPNNLRNALGVAPSQRFLTKAFPMACSVDEYYAFSGQMNTFNSLAVHNNAAFEAHEVNNSDNYMNNQYFQRKDLYPSAHTGLQNLGRYGVQNDGSMYGAQQASNNVDEWAFDNSEGLSKSLYPSKYHPKDEWVTITVNGMDKKVYRPFKEPVSADPTKVWSYYQMMGGDPQMHAAFNFDHIPFEVKDFSKDKLVDGIAVTVNAGANSTNFSGMNAHIYEKDADSATNTISGAYDELSLADWEKQQQILSHSREKYLSHKGFCQSDDDEFYPNHHVHSTSPIKNNNIEHQKYQPKHGRHSGQRTRRQESVTGGQLSAHNARHNASHITGSPTQDNRKSVSMNPDAAPFRYQNSNLVKAANFSSNFSAPASGIASSIGFNLSRVASPGSNAKAPDFRGDSGQRSLISAGIGAAALPFEHLDVDHDTSQASQGKQHMRTTGPSSAAIQPSLAYLGGTSGSDSRLDHHDYGAKDIVVASFIPNTDVPMRPDSRGSVLSHPRMASAFQPGGDNSSVPWQPRRPDRSRTFNPESRQRAAEYVAMKSTAGYKDRHPRGQNSGEMFSNFANGYSLPLSRGRSSHPIVLGEGFQGLTRNNLTSLGQQDLTAALANSDTYSQYSRGTAVDEEHDYRQLEALQGLAKCFARPASSRSRTSTVGAVSTVVPSEQKVIIPGIFRNLPRVSIPGETHTTHGIQLDPSKPSPFLFGKAQLPGYEERRAARAAYDSNLNHYIPPPTGHGYLDRFGLFKPVPIKETGQVLDDEVKLSPAIHDTKFQIGDLSGIDFNYRGN